MDSDAVDWRVRALVAEAALDLATESDLVDVLAPTALDAALASHAPLVAAAGAAVMRAALEHAIDAFSRLAPDAPRAHRAMDAADAALASDAGARAIAAMRQAEAAIAARATYWDDDHAPDEDAGTTEELLRAALAVLRTVIGGEPSQEG